MLHLSLLTLPRKSMRWRFMQPYELHQVLWRGFPDLPRHTQENRFLYRHDERNESHSVLVQSATAPDWRFIDDEAEGALAQVKQYDPTGISKGTRLRFFLRANPVVRRQGYDDGDKNGRGRHIVVGSDRARMAERLGVQKDSLPTREEQLLDWLRRQGEKGGFAILDSTHGTLNTVIGPNRDHIIRTGRKMAPMTFTSVDFDGILTVADQFAFINMLRQGVGRGKGFGFGLLSIKRVD